METRQNNHHYTFAHILPFFTSPPGPSRNPSVTVHLPRAHSCELEMPPPAQAFGPQARMPYPDFTRGAVTARVASRIGDPHDKNSFGKSLGLSITALVKYTRHAPIRRHTSQSNEPVRSLQTAPLFLLFFLHHAVLTTPEMGNDGGPQSGAETRAGLKAKSVKR
jgi:hypothetical protein